MMDDNLMCLACAHCGEITTFKRMPNVVHDAIILKNLQISGLTMQLAEITTQRDALLAACGALVRRVDILSASPTIIRKLDVLGLTEPIEQARAAIAKAQP